jgi:hypothetical protein
MGDPGPFAELGGYPLRHLVVHLVEGGRVDDVHALLTLDHRGRDDRRERPRPMPPVSV